MRAIIENSETSEISNSVFASHFFLLVHFLALIGWQQIFWEIFISSNVLDLDTSFSSLNVSPVAQWFVRVVSVTANVGRYPLIITLVLLLRSKNG